MATLDHIIMKVVDLEASITFYRDVLGFALEGTDGPFTLIRVGPECQLQLVQTPTNGMEHYAFAVSKTEFDAIMARLEARGIGHGPSFNTVGTNTGPGEETGARGVAPTLYFNDPSQHLLEIRWYAL